MKKNKKQQLAHYVVRMKKQLDSRGLQVERSELLAVTHLFKSRFTSSTEKTENKHFDAPARPNLIKGQTTKLLNNLDALNLFKNQKSELDSYDGVLSTKKLIQQLENPTSPIQLDCLFLLTTMLYKDDELLPKSHHHANVALVASKNEEELEEHKKKSS